MKDKSLRAIERVLDAAPMNWHFKTRTGRALHVIFFIPFVAVWAIAGLITGAMLIISVLGQYIKEGE